MRVQLRNWHGTIGEVGPLVRASRFLHFGTRVACYFALDSVRLILSTIIWPCLSSTLDQRSACLPRQHLGWHLLPSSYLPNPVNGSFNILNIRWSLGALFANFARDSFQVLVQIAASASFRLAWLGDVRQGCILGIELLMRHQRVNSFFEFSKCC